MTIYVSGHAISLAHPWQYLGWLALVIIMVKMIMSSVRVGQKYRSSELLANWPNDFFNKDYYVATFVGTLELAIYPVLISLGAWQAMVAGWG